jgi:hypothetical protein
LAVDFFFCFPFDLFCPLSLPVSLAFSIDEMWSAAAEQQQDTAAYEKQTPFAEG